MTKNQVAEMLSALRAVEWHRGPAEPRALSSHRLTIPIILLALAFSALCGWILLESRHAAEARATEAATSLVSSLRADIARNAEILNLSLEGVVKNLRLPGLDRLSPETRQLVLFDHSSTARFLTSVIVTDETGRITHDSRSLAPPQRPLSDRDYFQVHKDNDSMGLYISRPFVGRTTGQLLVAFSRRLSHPDGSFAGVVSAALQQSYFKNVFRDTSLGRNGSVTLMRTDGIVLMRWPFQENFIGSSARRADLFIHYPKSPSGHYQSRAVSDGIQRLFVYSQVEDLPLVIVVGQSVDDVLATWRWQAIGVGALMAVLCLLAVGLAIFLNRELARRHAAERKLSVLATTDGLTGLANRRHFNRVLGYEWRRALRNGTPIALLLIDADNFKNYNDAYGHPEGDKLLQAIAASISVNVKRPSDLGARYGGDEFVVLLSDTTPADAGMLAELIREHLHAACIANKVPPERARVSIGIACVVPGATAKPRDLVAVADKALYEAKTLGRNCIAFAEMDAPAPEAGGPADEGNLAALKRAAAAS